MQICRVRVGLRCLLLLSAGTWLCACNDAENPILRGVKHESSKPAKDTSVSATPDDQDTTLDYGFDRNVVDAEESASQPQGTDQQSTSVARRILDLNLPHDIKHGDIDINRESPWRQHTPAAESQTLPNFFERDAETSETSSVVDFSGKVHWEESAEEQTIPPLNTIEGLELEISVKTQ